LRAPLNVLAMAGALLGLSAPIAHSAPATPDSNPAAELGQAPRTYSVSDAVPGKDGIKRMAILRGLDKITGQAVNIDAPIGVPVRYATLTITAEYCYSTPPSQTPETTAFLEIVDHRPGKPPHEVFSGWMWASSPSLNAMQHPLYDVWVISCKTNLPGQEAPPVASTDAVKPVSPNAGAKDEAVKLPEGAGR
jgi:hypothetical protein